MNDQQHYQCRLSSTCSNESKITPTWTKVSATPWSGKAAHQAGYGRRVMACTISDDMPSNFVRTEFLPRASPQSASPSKLGSSAADVLPGGGPLKNPPVHGTRYRTLKYEKQIILEPIVTERKNSSNKANNNNSLTLIK